MSSVRSVPTDIVSTHDICRTCTESLFGDADICSTFHTNSTSQVVVRVVTYVVIKSSVSTKVIGVQLHQVSSITLDSHLPSVNIFLAVQRCDDHIFRHAVRTGDAMTLRHGDQLRLCLAGQKHLAFADASVRPLGQVLCVTTVGDRQDVIGVPTLRDVFTLFEVADGAVRRCTAGNPV